jgi:flagella basal body P-ring formation protein FlgA
MSIRLFILCLIFTAQALSGATLDERVAEVLTRDLQLDTSMVRISVVHSDIGTNDLAGYELKVIPLTTTEPRGRYPVRVEVYRHDTLIEKGAASLDVRRLADVLVPLRGIKRGEVLNADLFTNKRIDVTSITENILTDQEQLCGSRARQDFMPDRVIPLSRLEKIPDVENGGSVIIIAGDGQLEVRAQGIALQSGRVGQSIQVRNTDTKKTLTGRVTAAGMVQVAL